MNGLYALEVLVNLADRLSGPIGGPIRKIQELRGVTLQADAAMDKLRSGAAIAGLGVAIAGSLFLATRAAGDFQLGLANIGTESKYTKTELDNIGVKVLDLSTKFGKMGTELEAGLYDVIGASVNGAGDGLGILEIAATDAVAGLTSTKTAADILTTGLNSYGMSADKAGFVSDVLFKTVAVGKTTFEQLASSMGTVLPISKAAGVSFVEINAAVGALTANGIGTSEAVTYVRSALSNILKPSSEAVKLAKKLGLEFNATSLQSKGLSGFLDSVSNATKGNVSQLSLLFGSVEATNAVMALTSVDGAARFKDALEQIGNSSGATDTAFKKIQDTFNFGLDRIKTQINKFMIQSGNLILPAVTEIVQGANMLFDKINGGLGVLNAWAKENRGLANTLVKLTLGVSAALIVVGTFVAGLGFVGFASAQAKLGLEFFKLSIGGIAARATGAVASLIATGAAAQGLNLEMMAMDGIKLGGFKTFGLILSGLKVGFLQAAAGAKTFALSLLANPIFWIIAAILALGAAFVWAWNNVKEFKTNVMNILAPLGAAWSDLKQAFNGVLESLGLLSPTLQGGLSGLSGFFLTVAGYVAFALGFILTLAVGVFARLVGVATQFAAGWLDIISGVVLLVVGLFTGDMDKARKGVGKIWQGIVKVISSPLRLAGVKWFEAKKTITDMWNWVTSQKWFQLGVNIVLGIANGIASAAATAFKAIKDVAVGIAGVFTNKTQQKSPSRLFSHYGLMLGAGLTLGILSSIPDVHKATAKLAIMPPPIKIQAPQLIKPASSALTLTPQIAKTPTFTPPTIVPQIAKIPALEPFKTPSIPAPKLEPFKTPTIASPSLTGVPKLEPVQTLTLKINPLAPITVTVIPQIAALPKLGSVNLEQPTLPALQALDMNTRLNPLEPIAKDDEERPGLSNAPVQPRALAAVNQPRAASRAAPVIHFGDIHISAVQQTGEKSIDFEKRIKTMMSDAVLEALEIAAMEEGMV